MNSQMAEAWIKALHLGVPAKSLYAIAAAFGYTIDEDYGFEKGVWRFDDKRLMRPDDRQETARFFRDLADALAARKTEGG